MLRADQPNRTMQNNQPTNAPAFFPAASSPRFIRCLLAVCLLAATPATFASGFRLPNVDPDAVARGDAFAATADNPSAIYYNPAGITQIEGTSLRVGTYAISLDYRFTSATAGTARTDNSLQAIPQVYFTHSFSNAPLSIGLGIYAPFGLGIDWGRQSPLDTVGQNDSLLYLTVNPVIAWRVTPKFSLAAGPTINYSQVTFQQALNPSGASYFKFSGHDTGFGFNAGALWQPLAELSLGAMYHAGGQLDYEGTTTQNLLGPPFAGHSVSTAGVQFPQFAVLGVSYRPTPKWNLELDIDWTDWSSLKNITFLHTPLGNQTVTLNYRDSFMYEFGATRQLKNGYYASAGYMFWQNSSPDSHYNPLIPDGNLHFASMGFGHHGRRFDWGVAYHFAINGGRTVSNDANAAANGTYHTFNNAFDVAVTYKF
jgi:long-chain fatty acid transport protein